MQRSRHPFLSQEESFEGRNVQAASRRPVLDAIIAFRLEDRAERFGPETALPL